MARLSPFFARSAALDPCFPCIGQCRAHRSTRIMRGYGSLADGPGSIAFALIRRRNAQMTLSGSTEPTGTFVQLQAGRRGRHSG